MARPRSVIALLKQHAWEALEDREDYCMSYSCVPARACVRPLPKQSSQSSLILPSLDLSRAWRWEDRVKTGRMGGSGRVFAEILRQFLPVDRLAVLVDEVDFRPDQPD